MIVRANSMIARLACLLPARLVAVMHVRVGADCVNFVEVTSARTARNKHKVYLSKNTWL